MSFNLNGQSLTIPPEWADELLLFLLREHFGLTSAKFGCGVGICGACTILTDGVPRRTCMMRIGDVDGLSRAHDENIRRNRFCFGRDDAPCRGRAVPARYLHPRADIRDRACFTHGQA